MAMSSQARAQSTQDIPDAFTITNEVLSRPRPGLEPTGARIGAFTLFPVVTASIGYNDDVYDWDTYKRDSVVATIEPQATLQSNWSRNSATLEASGRFNRYTAEPANNFDVYRVAGNGRLDVGADNSLAFGAHYLSGVEPRGTVGDAFPASDPVQYQSYGGSARATGTFGQALLEIGADVDRLKYDDVQSGDVILSQTYRNRLQTAFSARGGLAIGPSVTGYVQGFYDNEDYDVSGPTDLSSKGWRVLGGADFRITRLIVGRIGLGYLFRNYRNPTFRSVSGFNYTGRVVWNVTPLVSLTFDAERQIVESPQIGISGVIQDRGQVMADYEILRRLLANFSVGYTAERYRGEDRLDRRFEGSLGFRYLANRFAELGLRFEHRGQSSRGALGREYASNIVTLSVSIQR